MYQDLIYWAQRPSSFSAEGQVIAPEEIPRQALLSLVASEWLNMSEYIKTRLGQIEWEVSYPEHFLAKESNIDVPLKKLHIWRRLVPLYREMLNETLQSVFKFPAHTMGNSDPALSNPSSPDTSQRIITKLSGKSPVGEGTLEEEFTRALSYMEEYQLKIDRLTSVVTAIISIGDSRHSQEDNRNVARLTWLATFFIPLGFVASLFSMTEDVTTLMKTYKWFAVVAVPLACLSIGLGVILTLPQVQRWWGEVSKMWESWTDVRKKA
jgi:Mg2+ and Co2+ transporter CorA